MSEQDFAAILRDLPFFQGMKEEHIAELAGCASYASFQAGQSVFHQGEDADRIYVIRSGRIAVDVESVDRGMTTIQTLDADDVLGWSWLFPPYVWSFGARAVETTRTIAMDARCLRGKCEADTDLGYALLKRFSAVIVDRLRATRIQLLDICH